MCVCLSGAQAHVVACLSSAGQIHGIGTVEVLMRAGDLTRFENEKRRKTKAISGKKSLNCEEWRGTAARRTGPKWSEFVMTTILVEMTLHH